MSTKQENTEGSSAAQRWLGYRPEIRVLDCTIRDGGLMNDHMFDNEVIKAIYASCVEGGIDYLEFGYKASKKIFARDKFGAWKFCDEDDIRRIVDENDTPMKLTVMADAERTDCDVDILPKEQSVIDVIRVATYVHQIPTAINMIKDAHDKGYETTCNLMAISTIQEWELDQALEALAETELDVMYLVDSFGALYSEQIQYLTKKYLKYMKAAGKEVGIHTHNNQQLGYANTIEAIIQGANRLDGSLAGLGRGAGNCQTELLIGFLHNPKFKLRPILKCIRDHIEPLRKDLKWGYDIPYMLTGQLNRHPRPAMKFNESDGPKDIVAFYDMIIEED